MTSSQEIEVETRTLDEYELDVGFIKIDVEGHELAVLDGAKGTIEKSRPNMLVECNDEHNPGAVRKLARWLDDAEYNAHFVFDRNLVQISRFEDSTHWQKYDIENFICIHKTRDDVQHEVENRLSTIRWRRGQTLAAGRQG
jgi:hypothetical protein